MDTQLANKLTQTISKELFLDLQDMAQARALKAFEIIRDNTELKGKSARGAEGQIRFRIFEQGFQSVCELHGAQLLQGGLVTGKAVRFHQPFMRFGSDGAGVILGLASMPTRGKLPSKNKSRLAGVSLNYNLTPRLALDASDPKPGDIFVLFLVARDAAKSGRIDEIAIGVIDTNYESYIFYETIESIMAYYAAPAAPAPTPESTAAEPEQRLVKLKGRRKAYKPPEKLDDEDQEAHEK